MHRTFQIKGKRYRINLEKTAEFVGALMTALMAAGAFVLFFGLCYGGFLR